MFVVVDKTNAHVFGFDNIWPANTIKLICYKSITAGLEEGAKFPFYQFYIRYYLYQVVFTVRTIIKKIFNPAWISYALHLSYVDLDFCAVYLYSNSTPYNFVIMTITRFYGNFNSRKTSLKKWYRYIIYAYKESTSVISRHKIIYLNAIASGPPFPFRAS